MMNTRCGTHSLHGSSAVHSPTAPLLAVDLDDVLMATNASVAQWHNRTYHTRMALDDFYYNPYWGTPEETLEKVNAYYASSYFRDAPAVQGAIEGVAALKRAGYRLTIVTARSSSQSELTEEWIGKHLPDCFEAIYYTGEFTSLRRDPNARSPVKMTKSEVIRTIGAFALVDDSLDNAIQCGTAGVPVLLFGDYQWNKRISKAESPTDYMGYVERCEMEGREGWWNKDLVADADLPSGVKRVSGWKDVLEAVRRLACP